MTPRDPYQWLDPSDAVFVASCREALVIERRAYAAADAERKRLLAAPDKAMVAIRAALPILDDDLAAFKNDASSRLFDKRGFVCLDDLGQADHDRWKECEATLTALAAIRDVLPPDEWADNTYAETQDAVEHFRQTKKAVP